MSAELAAAALARARALGFEVVVADLGDWGARVRPCAELDLAARRIRVDARLLEAARARLGAAAAARLTALAIDHELAHARDPKLAEGAVRRGVDAAAGLEADALVRAALGR